MMRRIAGQASVSSISRRNLDRQVTKRSVLSGKIEGNGLDWNELLYYDPISGALHDSGELDARKIRDMLRSDWKARQLELALTLPIKAATWKLTPGAGPNGEAVAKDTEEKLRRDHHAGGMRTPMKRVIGQMTSAFSYRRAYFAKGFQLDPVANDGSVMYSDLAMRPATTARISLDPETGLYDGFEQELSMYFNDWAKSSRLHGQVHRNRPGYDGQPIRFKKHQAMTFVYGMDRNPILGAADLEIAYWCWRTKQKLLFLLLDFAQATALPRTLVGHKGDVEKAKAAAQVIAKLKSSGVGYYDANQINVDTLDVSGKGGTVFQSIITYLDQCSSGSVLASFLDLGQQPGRGSSLALSKDQSDFFLQTRESAADEIEECLTEQAVSPLVRLNWGHTAPLPTFQFDALSGVDEQPVIALLTALATAPASTLPQEFISELAIEAARILNLDVDKITAALQSAAYKAQQAAATQAAAQPPGAAPTIGNPAAAGVAATHAVVQKAHQILSQAVKP